MAFSYIPKHQGKHYQFLQFQLEAEIKKFWGKEIQSLSELLYKI